MDKPGGKPLAEYVSASPFASLALSLNESARPTLWLWLATRASVGGVGAGVTVQVNSLLGLSA